MSETTVVVEERSETGTGPNRRLRRDGRIPAVVYGGDKEAVAISVDERTMHELMKGGNDNAIFLLQLGKSGKSRHAMIRELDIDPISRTIRHIDFLRVMMDEKVRVEVHVELHGVPSGVRNADGVLDFQTREIEIECLPGDIPPRIDLDVTAMEIGDHVEAGALELPAGVELLSDPHQVVVSVAHSRVSAVVEAEAAEEGLLETELAEPEVIRRGKEEESEDDED
ncbi:MAG: 50S ribosomal protein L25 [Thermoanaerobaculia bacterium]